MASEELEEQNTSSQDSAIGTDEPQDKVIEPADDEQLDADTPDADTAQSQIVSEDDPTESSQGAVESADKTTIETGAEGESVEIPDDDMQGEADAGDTASERKSRPRVRKALIALAAAAFIIIAGCCVALAADDNSRTQKVPETTTLDGQIDVSGMTQDELAEAVEKRAAGGIATVVSLDVNGESYDVDLLDVGTLAVEDTIAQAFAPYNTNIFMRWGERIVELATGDTGRYEIYTAYSIDHEALVARVTEIANDANTEAKDAGYEYNSDANALVPTAPVDGVELNVEATVSSIEKAVLTPNDTSASRFVVQSTAAVTAPEELEPGQAIFVDTRNCRVHLYENGEEVASYACTPGQSGYATPKGNFYLEYKDAAPTWINPHSEWSANMPDTIAPGASNPLGLRALAVSCGGGIYIHGTTNTGGLGYPGSHGCIRLSNSNIVELYDRVSEGIPIIIR